MKIQDCFLFFEIDVKILSKNEHNDVKVSAIIARDSETKLIKA